MIAIDTNILVRHLVNDDLAQARAARELIESLTPERPGFICREVAIEVVWVLERSYKFPRTRIVAALEQLAASNNIVIESSEEVVTAAAAYEERRADFADLMILASSERANARPLYTFDRRFARLGGVNLLATDNC